MAEPTGATRKPFQAEVSQLLDILAKSLYTHREIFLRELISNASDALDKLRFETTRGTEVADPGQPLEIRITADKEKGILTVSDTGIGMTEQEAIDNIGTIARSGSAEFLRNAAESGQPVDAIIGKFGVGFYSVFMVAEEATITTRSHQPEAAPVAWSSDGRGMYEVGPGPEGMTRGTVVELKLKEDAKDMADPASLKEIVRKHSSFIGFPVFVGDEQINTIPALWREPKFNVTAEQYTEFYKFLTFESDDPFETIHISVDAPVQYNALLFIPKHTFDLPGFQRERPGLDLYIRRVLIQRGNKDLVPEYLGFLRGVVDSEDLPLNISRESVQEDRNLNRITTNITRQVLQHLVKVAEDDPERYKAFWREHGRMLKLGNHDFANRERYAELLRFNSSAEEDEKGLLSLARYVERAKPGQKEIYYVFGPNREAIRLNPHLEIFRSKGLEVLYLFEPLDEFVLDSIRAYKEFNIRSVEHADLKELEQFESQAPEETPEPLDEDENKEFDKFLERIKDILADKVTAVRVSDRLRESPVCLVSPDGDMTSSMQKILRLVNKESGMPPKVLEINRDHRLIRNLFAVYEADPQDRFLSSAVEQLYESTLLLEGYIQDPHAMVSRTYDLLHQSSGWYREVKKS